MLVVTGASTATAWGRRGGEAVIRDRHDRIWTQADSGFAQLEVYKGQNLGGWAANLLRRLCLAGAGVCGFALVLIRLAQEP